MGYKPKIITGKVTGTGWPIDGHVLYFSQWDYDNYDSWHLYGWDDADDEAVMETMFITETEAGLCCYDTLETFAEVWRAKKWEPEGVFCLELDQVEVIEVKQEEQKDDTREKLRKFGIDLTPRKDGEKGGILCLPLDENLNGDTKAKHPDWELIDCPNCGRKCWKSSEADKLKKSRASSGSVHAALWRRASSPPSGKTTHRTRRETGRREGGQSMGKENKWTTGCRVNGWCAASFWASRIPQNQPHPEGNRAQRRRVKREKRKQ